MKNLKKISKIFIMVVAIAAVFTSCKKTLPTAAFTYAPESIVQYDIVQFTNTSTDATSYLWDLGNGAFTSTEANPSIQFLTAGDVVVKLTATNEDGSQTTEQTITIAEPDNHYMLGDTKHTISTDFFWFQASMGGDPYLRLLTDVAGQDNPDLVKLYPNKGLGDIAQTYTWSASGDVGTYDHGYTANYAGFSYDWTAIGKSGGNLEITELDEDIYKITGEMVLSVGTWDFQTGLFTETSTETLSISYIGAITPLAK